MARTFVVIGMRGILLLTLGPRRRPNQKFTVVSVFRVCLSREQTNTNAQLLKLNDQLAHASRALESNPTWVFSSHFLHSPRQHGSSGSNQSGNCSGLLLSTEGATLPFLLFSVMLREVVLATADIRDAN